MNKIIINKICKVLLIIGLFYNLFVLAIKIRLMLLGVTVIWAYQHLPMNEWGQENLYPIVLMALIDLSCLIFILFSRASKGAEK